MSAETAPRPAQGLRERNKREKQARIRRAARELFLRRGFAAATAREICRRARIGTGTLFLYVRDKRDLLFWVFEDEARVLFAEGLAAARRASALPEALLALYRPFLDWYAAHPELARAVVQELFFREHEPERMGALTLEFMSHARQLVEEAQARGEVRADVSAELAAAACFAHYAFWVQGWLGSGLLSRAQAEGGLAAALALQLEGLKPPARRLGRKR